MGSSSNNNGTTTVRGPAHFRIDRRSSVLKGATVRWDVTVSMTGITAERKLEGRRAGVFGRGS